MDSSLIRNFSIIAHIDHGKSTLADRLLLATGVLTEREFRQQFLDDMDLERERGITIKARAVAMPFKAKDGKEYTLNLIDTPGHVDFNYEVSRSLQACEGAILVVDAAQGISAQTVANYLLALEADLTIIPVLNKIDLPAARPDEVMEELVDQFGIDPEEVLLISAKTGIGIEALMDAVIERFPSPEEDSKDPLRAMIFDAAYDDFRGVITFVRVVDGTITKGMKVEMMGTGRSYEVIDLGVFSARGEQPRKELVAGQVGYIVCNIKDLKEVKIGDTVKEHKGPKVEALPGFQVPKPMVYCGIYPTQNKDFELLRKALDKLALNDSSFTYTPESSEALGFGFRCGFLGLLHMEIVQERLEREADLDVVQTAPNVTYEVLQKDGELIQIHSPSDVPDPTNIAEFREPIVRLQMITPQDSVGTMMQLCEERRGTFKNQEYLSRERVILTYDLPLAEILFDFYDKLKSATRGYGTMDYDIIGYQPSQLVKMNILINKESVDALSVILHRDTAEPRGRKLLTKLRKEIPRQMFEIPLQAAIGGKIIARETVRAMRKDVLAKCYGGDVTRKRKLLEKQKEGKKRMKNVGNVEVPQKAFLSVLGGGDEN